MRRSVGYVFLLLVLISSYSGLAQSLLSEKTKTDKNFKVIIFIGLECPISQKYMKKIEDMKNKFVSEVDFFAVVPERTSIQQREAFQGEYNSTLVFIDDHTLSLAQQVNATVTPEVFLYSKNEQLVYQGGIDNWFYKLGKYRRQTTEHYLIDAIETSLAGRIPKVKKTEAIGCMIQLPLQKENHTHH